MRHHHCGALDSRATRANQGRRRVSPTRTRIHVPRAQTPAHVSRHVSSRHVSRLTLPATLATATSVLPCHAAFPSSSKLWKYITGDAQPPHFSETDDDDDDTLHIQYQTQLEDWNSVNSKIITWFSNTSVSSIHSLFTPFETAKEVWDYLAERYSSIDGANEYQFGLGLHHIRFDSVGQALSELRFEETRKKTMVYQHSQPVLVTPVWARLQPPSQRDTHSYEDCRSRSKSKRKGYHNRQIAAVTDSSGSSPDSSSSILTAADVETIVTQPVAII
ncbi:hypothetical protein Acr_20g0010190 [Actinidia rufa]|uniref:Uncharacterized protein n=1 Tax=Actinidia rufa TaxID=165716 RepID=A0A7J0GEL4_9ERIC|nr:hypothetical protein Acr_20g0010190 [Actinidia rufa]